MVADSASESSSSDSSCEHEGPEAVHSDSDVADTAVEEEKAAPVEPPAAEQAAHPHVPGDVHDVLGTLNATEFAADPIAYLTSMSTAWLGPRPVDPTSTNPRRRLVRSSPNMR